MNVGDYPGSQKCRTQCICGGILRRTFTGIFFHRGIDPHYNRALGRYVSGQRSLKEGFKVASAEMSERMNQEVRYAPVDPHDYAACGVSEEAVEKRDKNLLAAGKREKKVIIS